ncbi:amino acid transporter [Christiangramia gaetbulicola]|uniref:Amino acid transporter n=1 Tax=Christiangramia gaetbulicola TaxID=703340 RepID=A0A2T6AIR3_9FLAO|nr:amino acid permease [Christiangramia gaetbulicola]PTX43703.1 amino acid transporter [Christiangramia gaetbulicola]
MKSFFKTRSQNNDPVIPSVRGGLGTFGGVFTPSILTILGVIMYLRFGWVVGNVGLLGTLLIVTLSVSITFLTALSVASIATDQQVRAGGAYYMISRSLGVEAGGAIGIPLFIALALSIALYTVGFAESVVSVFPELDFKTVGMVTTVLVGILAMISAKAAIKAQYFIMFGIGLSLLSLAFGSPIEETNIEMWGTTTGESEGFWVVFAVFFPAVTGIMAGVNMSGDLKNPSKSIPKGTFAAIGVGYFIYMALPIILANRADAETLIADPLIMRKISYWGDAILIGVWGATLSSAVGSILGAPRVLQALARDRVLPQWLSWLGIGSAKDDSPRYGTLFTMVVALIAVYLGNLNIIAPILTMFFLTTYGVLNAAAGIEGILDSPSFRPAFKIHWIFSLLGTLGCIAVMFLINGVATGIAFIFITIIFVWLQSREMKTAWGDVRRGVWMALVRVSLLNLRTEKESKTWRPNPLVLSGAPTKRWHLIDFASNITHNRGILTVATVLTSSHTTIERRKQMQNNIEDFLTKKGSRGFARVIEAEDTFKGAEDFVKAYGLASLEPNTIILGDSESIAYRKKYCDMITKFYKLNRNLVIVRDNKEKGFGNREKIDIWWGGLKGNGGLLMILAYLLKSSRAWYGARVTLKMMVDNEKAGEDARHNITQVIKKLRTGFKLEVIVSNGQSFDEVLQQSSANADLIFMGMATPDSNFESYYTNLQYRLKDLPTTILVKAAEEISFGEVLMQQDVFRKD